VDPAVLLRDTQLWIEDVQRRNTQYPHFTTKAPKTPAGIDVSQYPAQVPVPIANALQRAKVRSKISRSSKAHMSWGLELKGLE